MQPCLTTQRLALTPLTADDGPRLAEVFAGAGVHRYLFDNEDVSAEAVRTIVVDNLRRGADGLGLWLMAKDDAVIGCIGLQRALPSTVQAFPAFDGEVEVVVALMKHHRGAGYAREALEALLVYAADRLAERRIVAVIDVPNERSHTLFKGSGFNPVGSGQGPLYRAVAYERHLP